MLRELRVLDGQSPTRHSKKLQSCVKFFREYELSNAGENGNLILNVLEDRQQLGTEADALSAEIEKTDRRQAQLSNCQIDRM